MRCADSANTDVLDVMRCLFRSALMTTFPCDSSHYLDSKVHLKLWCQDNIHRIKEEREVYSYSHVLYG